MLVEYGLRFVHMCASQKVNCIYRLHDFYGSSTVRNTLVLIMQVILSFSSHATQVELSLAIRRRHFYQIMVNI